MFLKYHLIHATPHAAWKRGFPWEAPWDTTGCRGIPRGKPPRFPTTSQVGSRGMPRDPVGSLRLPTTSQVGSTGISRDAWDPMGIHPQITARGSSVGTHAITRDAMGRPHGIPWVQGKGVVFTGVRVSRANKASLWDFEKARGNSREQQPEAICVSWKLVRTRGNSRGLAGITVPGNSGLVGTRGVVGQRVRWVFKGSRWVPWDFMGLSWELPWSLVEIIVGSPMNANPVGYRGMPYGDMREPMGCRGIPRE